MNQLTIELIDIQKEWSSYSSVKIWNDSFFDLIQLVGITLYSLKLGWLIMITVTLVGVIIAIINTFSSQLQS